MKKTKATANFGTDGQIHHKLFGQLMKNKKAQESYEAEDVMFGFIEKVRAEMVKKHLTNYALAKKAKIDHQVLARILNGQKNAELATLTKVAHGVGAKLDLRLVFEKR